MPRQAHELGTAPARVRVPAPLSLLMSLQHAGAAAAACGLPAAAGYFCASGYCGCDGPLPHHSVPQCGPSLDELRLGGSSPNEKVQLAKRWCDKNTTCSGFAIDPGFAITLAFEGPNLTATAQPNEQWSIFWKGQPQPLVRFCTHHSSLRSAIARAESMGVATRATSPAEPVPVAAHSTEGSLFYRRAL